MKNYKMTLQYDGTRYSGWQRQGNTKNTIEYKISDVLTRMVNASEMIEIHGSGRTDAGVHAKGQVASFKLDTDKKTDEIVVYLNQYLPEDIKVLSLEIANERFHARLSAKQKSYQYIIDTSKWADVFTRKYAWNIGIKLDADKMKKAADLFVGKKDFRSFSDMKTDKKSSVRTIEAIDVKSEDNIIKITYTGDGFLYHMVRKVTAAIVEVALGNLSETDIAKMFEMCDKNSFKKMAPPEGLFLVSVSY